MNVQRAGLRGWLACIAVALLPAPTLAQVMNQIGTPPSGGSANMAFAPTASASQIFEAGNEPFNCMIVDDFALGAGLSQRVTTVHAAYSTSVAATVLSTAITGYRVSFFSSVANAAISGNNLDANAVATALIAPANVTIQTAFGPGTANSSLFTIDVSAANLVLPANGTYFVGVSPVMPFTPNGQVYSYASTFSSPAGGLNAFFINPGNGFGAGTSQAQAYNAAYAVAVVPIPEPALLGVVGLIGLVATRRLRRSKAA